MSVNYLRGAAAQSLRYDADVVREAVFSRDVLQMGTAQLASNRPLAGRDRKPHISWTSPGPWLSSIGHEFRLIFKICGQGVDSDPTSSRRGDGAQATRGSTEPGALPGAESG